MAEEPHPDPKARIEIKPPLNIEPPEGSAGMLVNIRAARNLIGVEEVLLGKRKADIVKEEIDEGEDEPGKLRYLLQVKVPKGGSGTVDVVVRMPHGEFKVGQFRYTEQSKGK
jgi:hypothetical protein